MLYHKEHDMNILVTPNIDTISCYTLKNINTCKINVSNMSYHSVCILCSVAILTLKGANVKLLILHVCDFPYDNHYRNIFGIFIIQLPNL